MKVLKDKKGASAIEMVIGFMIIIMMISFLLDIIDVLAKYSTVAQVSTDIARITGVQGGVLTKAPRGWPGGDDNYMDINEMNEAIEKRFSKSGMDASAWEVKIYNDSKSVSGGFGKNGKSVAEINYLDNYTVEVNLDFSWDVVSNFLPGRITQVLKSTRPATSEWQYNYHQWIGEEP